MSFERNSKYPPLHMWTGLWINKTRKGGKTYLKALIHKDDPDRRLSILIMPNNKKLTQGHPDYFIYFDRTPEEIIAAPFLLDLKRTRPGSDEEPDLGDEPTPF